MTIKNISFALATGLFFCSTVAGQTPRQADIESLIKKIPVIPPTVDELHTAFTINTKYGEKFGDAELLNPVYEEVKHLVATIHDPVIREKMKNYRRQDMPDSVQYEDERWKLALRPMLGPEILSRVPDLDPVVKDKISTILDMQKVFDWQTFYREQDNINKEFREKEALISQVTGLAMAIKKTELQKTVFTRQRNLWINRYHKYSQGFLRLQQLLRQLNYGTGLSIEEKKKIIPILADVQVRALEAIEKLIWTAFSMVTKAELIYQDEKMLKFYQQQ